MFLKVVLLGDAALGLTARSQVVAKPLETGSWGVKYCITLHQGRDASKILLSLVNITIQ